MKERPILFSGAMVQAILADRKSQTRRTAGLAYVNRNPDDWRLDGQGKLIGRWAVTFENVETGELHTAFCPYGQPGDRLWGRETWTRHFGALLYRADFGPESYEYGAKGWKPSIHMLRSDARLLFDLQQVRIERVQSISEADACAEGVEPYGGMAVQGSRYRHNFARLWDEINGKRGMSWLRNPWCWPLTIHRVSAQ